MLRHNGATWLNESLATQFDLNRYRSGSQSGGVQQLMSGLNYMLQPLRKTKGESSSLIVRAGEQATRSEHSGGPVRPSQGNERKPGLPR